MASLSWDGMVEHYDETRKADERCFTAALDYMLELFPCKEYPRVFEPGIGNGRIAIPLAERGYKLTGVDISIEMLTSLGGKIAGQPLGKRIAYTQGDVTSLPFATGEFDMAIASHLFWFVEDWQQSLREIRRVVKSAGPFILLNTGGGKEIARLNDRYKALCQEAGYSIRNPGAASNQNIVEYLTELGYRVEEVRDRWKWTSSLNVKEALGFIEQRAYSFAKLVPEEAHRKAIAALRAESQAGPEHENVHNQIVMFIARPQRPLQS